MHRAFAFLFAASLFAFSSFAEGTAKVAYTDPVGDITGDEGDAHPIDVVGVDLSSDGEFIVVGVTLTEPPRPQSLFQALLLGVAFDVDGSVKTGGQGFGGMHGDVPGIEFESELLASVEDGAPSKTSAASVIGVAEDGNQSSVLGWSDAPQVPVKGKTLFGRIAYKSLGVKSGQTIRVIARELNDRGPEQGMFPVANLKLK